MYFFAALLFGNALGLAADWLRQRGYRVATAGLVVVLLGAIVAAFLFQTEDFFVLTVLLVISFITGYVGFGRQYLRKAQARKSGSSP